jgi:predicted N-acyltransferase
MQVLTSEKLKKIEYFNSLLAETDLPLVETNSSPVFFIGTGMPITGYKFTQRLMKEGFYTNLGLFPAVPVKNTGIRITISRHNQEAEIKSLVEAMAYHFPLALEESNSNNNRVRRAFNLRELKEAKENLKLDLKVQYEASIKNIEKEEWNKLLGRRSTFDWDGLKFMEDVFKGQEKPENNWSFHYFIIRDKKSHPILATFFTKSLWKDDMLAPAAVSSHLEDKRKDDPYLMTSYVLCMGSLFTEGAHLFLDSSHPDHKAALSRLHLELEFLEKKLNTKMLVLRDFSPENDLNEIFHEQGFFKVNMPDSCVYENFIWKTQDDYLATLSSRSRRHFLKDIQPYEDMFDIEIEETIGTEEIDLLYDLYLNVKNNNRGLNTFTYPKNLFERMGENSNWEFIVLRLKNEFCVGRTNKPIGVMFCYKNLNYTYVPNYIGMDYRYTEEFQIYRQLLFQTIKRAKEINFQKIDFGMTASFEKKKVGATVRPQISYVQARENFAIEMLELLPNDSKK